MRRIIFYEKALLCQRRYYGMKKRIFSNFTGNKKTKTSYGSHRKTGSQLVSRLFDDNPALAWSLTFLLVAIISYLTLFISGNGTSTPSFTDKIYHFLAFAALSSPVALFHPSSLAWALPPMAAFGGAIEVIQPYVGRGQELNDFIADLIGLAVGAILAAMVRKGLKTWGRQRAPYPA